MKQFRKILAVLLIAVMAIGFALPAAAADDSIAPRFSDGASIEHKDAVYVLAALNVISGYPNGTFRPTVSVTRAEIAKILAVMFNEGVDPADQYAAACTFADSANHWAKGYIGYCVTHKLVNGKNASTFDPDGKVTCAEQSKMLLCALGYDANEEGFTGSDWKYNVTAAAANIKLTDGLDKIKPDEPMTRDSACRLILNALEATMVEYPHFANTDINISGITISGGRGEATFVKYDAHDYQDRAVSAPVPESDVGWNSMQLCEKLFPKLKLSSTVSQNEIGAPASKWTYDNRDIGVYQVQKALMSGDGVLRGNAVAKALGKETPLKCTVYLDGKFVDEFGVSPDECADNFKTAVAAYATKSKDDIIRAAASAKKGDAMFAAIAGNTAAGSLVQIWRNESKITSLRAFTAAGADNSATTLGGSGIHYSVYYDAKEHHLTVCSQRYYPATIKSIQPAITDGEGNVTRNGYVTAELIQKPATYAGCKQFDLSETVKTPAGNAVTAYLSSSTLSGESEEELKVGDHVALLFGHDPDTAKVSPTPDKDFIVEGGIILDHASGAVTQVYESTGSSLSSFKLGSTNYVKAQQFSGSVSFKTLIAGQYYTVFYHTFGSNLVAFDVQTETGTAKERYAYVLQAGTIGGSNFGEQKYGAVIVGGDGKQKTVETAANYGVAGPDYAVGKLVTSTHDSKDVYTFSIDAGTTFFSTTPNNPVSIKNRVASFSINGTQLTGNNDTVFLIGEKDGTSDNLTFTSYLGMSEVPNVTSAKYWSYHVDATGHADFVVLEEATAAEAAGSEYGMLVLADKESHTTDSDGTSYYEARAVVKGSIQTVKISEACYNKLTANGTDYGLKPFSGFAKDDKGIITRVTTVAKTLITTMTKPEKGVVTFNGTTNLQYHNNTLAYVYHASDNLLEVLTTVEQLEEITAPAAFASFYTTSDSSGETLLSGIFVCTND